MNSMFTLTFIDVDEQARAVFPAGGDLLSSFAEVAHA